MNEFRKFAEDDDPEVGDTVQLLNDSGTPDINKVSIAEIVRIVDRTSLSGDTGITPAVSRVWEVKDTEGMNWMVARNPEIDDGGKKGYLQVRIAMNREYGKTSVSDYEKQLEMGIKVELEHKDTIKKFRKYPDMTDREVAEMIAKDHLGEKNDYYTALKEMESKASLLKKKSGFSDWWLDNRNSESLYETYKNCMDDLKQSAGEEPVSFIDWARKHYENMTSASLLKEAMVEVVSIGQRENVHGQTYEYWKGNDGRYYVIVNDQFHSVVSGTGEPDYPVHNVVKKVADVEDRLSNPIDDVGTKSHYDLNQSVASLLGLEEDSKESTSWYSTVKEALNSARSMQVKYRADGYPCDVGQVANGWYRLEGNRVQPWNFRVKYPENQEVVNVTRTMSSLLKEEELDVFDKHQLNIARQTLKMNDTMARIMGGMTKDEAREIIKRLTGREVKESIVNTKASLLKTETINEDVIHIFLSNRFPKDKSENWGTANLKIVKEPDGWSLVNYWTRILYRGAGGKVYFNTNKYSATTTRIQREIQRVAKELGVKLIPVEDDSLDESINKDTTPGSSPVETTPENPPLEEPTPGDYLWTGRHEPGIGGDLEEPGRHVTVTNASLLKESEKKGKVCPRCGNGTVDEDGKCDNCGAYYPEEREHSSSLLKESGLENHVMEVLTAAGVAHLVEWDEGNLRLIKKKMGSGSEFADEVIKALGNNGAFGTVTYDVEKNQFNFGIHPMYEQDTPATQASLLKSSAIK